MKFKKMKEKCKDCLSIIIVDDIELIRTELKFMLKDYPQLEVVGEASSGEEAIEAISKIRPDVVFLDIEMPTLSGFQVLDRVERDFKVVFISSFTKYLPMTKKYNSVDFLMKPINKTRLLEAVKKLQLN